MHKLLNYILLCSSTMLMAQQTQVTGTITKVTTPNGLHKIEIPPLVRSYAAADIHDFRIMDVNNEQVPYFTHRDSNETRISDFTDFEIISQNKIPDSSSTYIFKNPNKELKKMVLSIANYTGSKQLNIQGSNDQKEWFGLVNSQQLYNIKSLTSTNSYKVLKVPLTSYPYIKIVFDDRHSLPINLLKIGTAKTIVQKVELNPIPVKEVTTTQLEKEKKTLVKVRFEHPETLHQMYFTISAPEFFNRKTRVYTLATKMIKNKKETYKKYLANFVLRSDGTRRFPIPIEFEQEFYIEIENGDNPKLQIAEISFFQEPLYVIANLKKGEEYRITAGDKRMKAPNYDLSYFKNRTTGTLPNVTITNVQYSTPEIITETKEASLWQQSWFMWSCIGLAGIVVAYFASSLIKDLKVDDQE